MQKPGRHEESYREQFGPSHHGSHRLGMNRMHCEQQRGHEGNRPGLRFRFEERFEKQIEQECDRGVQQQIDEVIAERLGASCRPIQGKG
jgi:hypothetical protein